MFSVFFARAYARPRELTWWTGAALFGLTLAFGFSGYLLPWNTRAFFATQVGTDLLGKVPLAGRGLLRFLRGGDEVSGATLTRFFGFHVAVLPLLTCFVLGAHLLLVQRHGLHVPRSLEDESRQRPYLPFVPDFALRELAVWLAALAALVTLATLYPWELGQRADPFASAPAGIRPEWYFLFAFEALKLIPARVAGVEGELVGLAAFTAAGLLWLLFPVLERAARRGKSRRLATGTGLVAIAFVTVMTALALRGSSSP
jgi:cytochrome b6